MDWPYTSPLKKSSKRSLLDDDDEELVHWDTLEQTDESSSWKEKVSIIETYIFFTTFCFRKFT